MNSILILCGLIVIALGCGLGYLYYYLAFKRPLYRAEHYTAQTTGTVQGPSHFTSNGIVIPLVEYTVDGVKHKVAGPRFAGYVNKFIDINGTLIGGSASNIQPDGELPVIIRSTNGLGIVQAAVNERYPVGKQVTVFYNPDCPKKAFVERDTPFPKKLSVILIAVCIIVVLVGVAFCIGGFI